jgi:hypothetical protein
MAKSPFSVNYDNLEDVITYCKELGGSSVVINRPDRLNYNITFLERVGPRDKVFYPESKGQRVWMTAFGTDLIRITPEQASFLSNRGKQVWLD